MNNEPLSDPNVIELRQLSDPIEFGNMLRLATEMELLRDSDVGESSLWAYLKAKNFEPAFIEKTAKVYWQKTCRIVSSLPYSTIIARGGVDSERRLMAHLLRQVCELITQEA